MADQSPAPDAERLAAGVREALTLAGLREDQPATRGGFRLYPRRTSVDVHWSPHGDLDAATWAALEKDPHHTVVAWEDRVRESMLRAMSDILWSAGFTVAFTPAGTEEDGIASGLTVLRGRRRGDGAQRT
jgi:hypothetical protein